jgi:hypothetical protein
MIQTIRRVMSVTKPLNWGNHPCGGEPGATGPAARAARDSLRRRRQATRQTLATDARPPCAAA